MIHHGQAPTQNKYLLVGSGRLAFHLSFYFKSLNLEFSSWSRQLTSTLHDHLLLHQPTHVLLAISDRSLETITQDILKTRPHTTIIHFSGAASIAKTYSAHPLMTFSQTLYPASFYKKIHFVVHGTEKIQDLLPELPNSSSQIFASEKALYHALCVMAGNFPQLLWTKVAETFAQKNIPDSALSLYLEAVTQNYIQQGKKALTGPLVRNDQPTIDKNLSSLANDPWQEVYQAFVNVYQAPKDPSQTEEIFK